MWLSAHYREEIHPDMTSYFVPTYNSDVPNGTTLLKRIIGCMVSPDFKLEKFDVRLSDDEYMDSPQIERIIRHRMWNPRIKQKQVKRIISLPRLVLKNANQMLDETAPNVKVFFYNQEYPQDFMRMSKLFVIYPIKDENYQRQYSNEIERKLAQDYLNSFLSYSITLIKYSFFMMNLLIEHKK